MANNDLSDFTPDTSDFTPDTSDFTPDAPAPQRTVPNQNLTPAKEGFLGAIGGDLWGMAKSAGTLGIAASGNPSAQYQVVQGIADQIKNAPAEWAARKKAGYSAFYRTIAPMAQAAGLNVPGMEQAAVAGDPAGVLGHAAAPIAAYGLIKGVGAAAEAIPTQASGGAKLAQAKALAGNIPVDATASIQAAIEAKKLINAGGRNVPVVSKFLTRIKDPTPLTYEEIRNFYSNASKLSNQDVSNLNNNLRRVVGNFAQKLGEAAQDAANRGGAGELHASGMREYRQASQLKSAVKATAAIGTAGLGGHYVLNRIMHMLSGGR